MFREAWNSHGIRTEQHLSPHQLYTAGVLRLHSSRLVDLDFLDQVHENYGVSPDDPIPELDGNAVIIPETRFDISDRVFLQLQQQVDPLTESTNYDIELYLQTLHVSIVL